VETDTDHRRHAVGPTARQRIYRDMRARNERRARLMRARNGQRKDRLTTRQWHVGLSPDRDVED
jgi:hypothetical protein